MNQAEEIFVILQKDANRKDEKPKADSIRKGR